MRLDSITIRGMGPFRAETSVDLSAIDGDLVAVTGPNGAGKSTLLELFAGAMYRRTPTRGSLVDLATTRDAFVEARVKNGAPWTLRQTCDAVSGKSEALVLDAGGASVLPTTKVRDYDEWAARKLVAEDVLYATTFQAQGAGGFLDMKTGERKALLLKVLGIEKLEGYAAAAREAARAAKTALDVVQARIAEIGEVDLERAGADQRSAVAAAAARAEELAAARKALAAVEAEAERLRVMVEAERERDRQRVALSSTCALAMARIVDLDARIANNRATLSNADTIRKEAELAAQTDAQLGELREALASARGAALAADEAHRVAQEGVLVATDALKAARARAEDAKARQAKRAEAAKDAKKLPSAIEAVERLAVELRAVGAHIDSLHAVAASGAEGRIAGLRTALEAVSVDVPDAVEIAAKALATDTESALALASQPAKLRAASAERAQLRDAHAEAAREVARLESRKAFAEAPHADGDVEAETTRAHERLDASSDEVQRTRAVLAQAGQVMQGLQARLENLTQRRRGLDMSVSLVERLATAEARLAELQPQRDAAAAEEQAARGQLALLSQPSIIPAMPDVAAARAAVQTLERSEAYALVEIKAADAALEQAIERAGRLGILQIERARAEEDLADWSRLGADLGRDGVQAMLVDAAAPELTMLANDLLHECVGPRWTVSLETQRTSSDGKKQIEGCDVHVLDTERGREANAETLSGGERVLVGEAASLALTMLSCRQNSIEGPTLVRDESGAALDPANARAYIAMLRRAAKYVGASRVLFVSHSPAVQDLADARIAIVDGTITLEAA